MSELLEMARQSARRAGIPLKSLAVDSWHPQTLNAVDSRSVPRPLSFGTMQAHFYNTLFRWELDSGERGALLAAPIIRQRGAGPYYELDGLAMLQGLFEKLRGHYRSEPNPHV